MIPFYRTPVLDISIPPSPQLMATVWPNRPTRQLQGVATFPSSPNSPNNRSLSQAAGLALGFQENQDVVLANWTHGARLVAGRTSPKDCGGIPGPLTFLMMERVVSSMNSTRTWVTPPREPVLEIVSASERGDGLKSWTRAYRFCRGHG